MSEELRGIVVRVLAGVFAFFLMSCVFYDEERCGPFSEIFRLKGNELQERVRDLPPERRIDLYFCAVCIEPPQDQFVEFLVEDCDDMVPRLLRRLQEEPEESYRGLAIYAFEQVSSRCEVEKAMKAGVIAKCEQVVSTMRDEVWREMSARSLRTIRRNWAGSGGLLRDDSVDQED